MLATPTLTGRGASRWTDNQAASSARMVERMMRDDLRKGNFANLEARVARVEELVGLQALKPEDNALLQLLAARLLDAAGESRRANLFVGRIIAAEGQFTGSLWYEVDRFRVRLHLNRGEVAEARRLVDRIEREVTHLPGEPGQGPREIVDESVRMVTAPTWLLSAEVALSERDFERAHRDLMRARELMSKAKSPADDLALYDLLTALVRVGREDDQAAPALAHLHYHHVERASESSVDAQTRSRVAAAAGVDLNQAACISQREATRWRGYGPYPAAVMAYLGLEAPPEFPRDESDELPPVDLLYQSLENTLTPQPAAQDLAPVAAEPDVRPEEVYSELPMGLSLAHYRIDSITSLFDNDRVTGPFRIDWSMCDPELIAEAIEAQALPEIAGRVKSGTIFINDGAYVDAVLHTDDPTLRAMPPMDVMFELFRIGMAQLPGTRASQPVCGPQASHSPELLNLRPNGYNLDITRMMDELKDPEGAAKRRQEEAVDFDTAFDSWAGFAPSDAAEEEAAPDAPRVDEVGGAVAAGAEDRVRVSARMIVEPLRHLFSASTLQDLCSALCGCLLELGGTGVRVEVGARVPDEEPLAAVGPRVAQYEVTWLKRDVGPLELRMTYAGFDPDSGGADERTPEELFPVLMDAAAQRLRLVSATRARGRMEIQGLVAADPATQTLLSLVRDLATLDGVSERQKNQPLMIVGERGTGKELVARACHGWSKRAEKPFVAINVGAIDRNLVVSEIFGHKRGAFTGAQSDRRGYIHAAEGGTLFLDEIDEADERTQALLKRVIQFGTYQMVGDAEEHTADVRIIAATNRVSSDDESIKEDVRDRFWPVVVPPLRERRGDIRPLAQFFAHQYDYELPEPVLGWLETLDWPGNVRQLQNTVERACSLARTPDQLTLEFIEKCVLDSGGVAGAGAEAEKVSGMSTFVPLQSGETIDMRYEKEVKRQIEHFLQVTGGNRQHTAELLGRTPTWVRGMMKKLGIKDVKE